MIIDCDTCLMRETTTCRDCVVMVLFSDGPLELDGDERAAIDTLADAGLVPRLRLVNDDSHGGDGHAADPDVASA